MQWTKLIINKSGYEKLISKQLIITGGCSQLDGFTVLTKNYLDFETRIGFPKEFKVNLDSNLSPSHAVASGIIQSIFNTFFDTHSFLLHILYFITHFIFLLHILF